MIFSSHQHPCTCYFPFQLLLLHHHCHKVLQWSQGLWMCFTRIWEHEGLGLESFFYKIAFGNTTSAWEEFSFSLPSSLKALDLRSFTFHAYWKKSPWCTDQILCFYCHSHKGAYEFLKLLAGFHHVPQEFYFLEVILLVPIKQKFVSYFLSFLYIAYL